MRNLNPIKSYYQENCRKIWETYRRSRATDYILRIGFYRYNVHSDIDRLVETMSKQGLSDSQLATLKSELAKLGAENTNRPDSVSEHSHGAAEIAIGINRFFPEVISQNQLKDCLILLHYHDLPETVIGDIPDNGCEAHLNKHVQELQIMEELTANWPTPERHVFLSHYRAFQSPKKALSQALRTYNYDTNTALAENAHACDKLDAVLKALIYESYGHIGYINPNQSTLKEQLTIEAVGTNNIVDCWACNFYETIEDYTHDYLFKSILSAAVLDIRGQDFSWLKNTSSL